MAIWGFTETQSSSSPLPLPQHEIVVDHQHYHQPLLQNFKGGGQEKQETDQCGTSTFANTCFNGLNALSGVGLLSIPYALSQGGWLSLILLFLVSAICCYTGLLLRRCMATNLAIRTYPQIGFHAFGSTGKLLVSIFMYMELYLVAIGFLILEGDNLDKLFPNTRVEFGDFYLEGKQFFVLLVALAILPTTWLKRLDFLAYISAGGVLASWIVVVSVFWAAIFDGVGFHGKGRMINFPGLPTALGLYAFCYCGHAIFPTLCNSMKEKTKFSKVLVVCFVLCNINYGLMAILGYLMYGDDINSQVTLNLPNGKLSSKIAIYTTLINPFTKYALMVAPVAAAIEEQLLLHNKRSFSLLIRTLVVLSTVIIALAVPFFGYLMTLIGSLLSVIVSFLLPCACYLKIIGPGRCHKAELAFIFGIVILGSFVATKGTYSSIIQIINEF
ncbi:Transmembrane amino acid transporter family protein [Rhynchospora pubera]|uniref:Transmembrane amino acid transporter family protein n=1 Tax=Rhynchospora pubera TaxID=906938 RepID=A0AAV8CFQ8_9POAL|nr:Transmembrane amino acid transporter family protein [Rhynchospora pubera]KAJ4794185.1 Transmembrane amino acid transporter family protein [Rhynchospora pubera]